MGSLTKRVAIVTGAAQGLGLAVAARLLAEGAFVTLADIQADKVAAAAARLDPSGEATLAIGFDASSSVDADRMVAATAARFGGVDSLVNVAGGSGTTRVERIDDMTDAIWDRIILNNLRATFVCSRAAVRRHAATRRRRHRRISPPARSVASPARTDVVGAARLCGGEGGNHRLHQSARQGFVGGEYCRERAAAGLRPHRARRARARNFRQPAGSRSAGDAGAPDATHARGNRLGRRFHPVARSRRGERVDDPPRWADRQPRPRPRARNAGAKRSPRDRDPQQAVLDPRATWVDDQLLRGSCRRHFLASSPPRPMPRPELRSELAASG